MVSLLSCLAGGLGGGSLVGQFGDRFGERFVSLESTIVLVLEDSSLARMTVISR